MELKSGDLFFYRTFSWEVKKKNREMIREDESAKRSKW